MLLSPTICHDSTGHQITMLELAPQWVLGSQVAEDQIQAPACHSCTVPVDEYNMAGFYYYYTAKWGIWSYQLLRLKSIRLS